MNQSTTRTSAGPSKGDSFKAENTAMLRFPVLDCGLLEKLVTSSLEELGAVERAFVADSLVLDEAISHLDMENERRICMTLRHAGITTFMNAHRRQTLDAADRVLTLTDGRLV